MPQVESKAAKAIQAIKARRFSYHDIVARLEWEHGISLSISHICRVSYGGREASPELSKALVALAKVMK